MTISLEDKKLHVLRHISPRDRWRTLEGEELVPDSCLAQKGLAIGNDLDSKGSKYHIGTQVKPDRWPVYVVQAEEEMSYFLTNQRFLTPAGSVIYTAKINLDVINIGVNIAFASKNQKKRESTILKLDQSSTEPFLYTDESIDSFDDKLKNKFDSEGKIIDFRGEFFLVNYKGYHQLEDELVYRSNGLEFIDITKRIITLRES